jgi:hypothetical protein
VFFGEPNQLGDDAARLYARHTMIDQLTFDPVAGWMGQLPAEGPVVLAWGDRNLLEVEIDGQEPRRTGNVLYFLPASMSVSGETTFRSDLLRSTVIESDAAFFSKDPYSINFGRGSAQLAYRPITFAGTMDTTQLVLGLNFGDPGFDVEPKPIEPLPRIPDCTRAGGDDLCPIGFDGLPEVELFDLTDSTWKRLPHLESGSRFAVAEPTRYVDPATGQVMIRFVNERNESVGFSLDVAITGNLR